MDSQDQVLEEEQSNGEQPEDNNTDIDINWEKISIDELKAGYLRQSDYTRKTQELSKLKKESTLTDEEKSAIEFLKTSWFATKDDLENYSKLQIQNQTIKQIIDTNPDLKPYEQAIKDLSVAHGIAPEDVIEKYGFKSKDKLAKARLQWDIKGSMETKAKSIAEMSDKEYAEYKIKIGFGQKKWWFI